MRSTSFSIKVMIDWKKLLKEVVEVGSVRESKEKMEKFRLSIF